MTLRARIWILFVIGAAAIASSSCQRKICAAYESYFLLNEQAQLEHFSPFSMADSVATPKKEVKTTFDANGIAQGPTPKNFRRRHYFIPMKDYMVVEDDSSAAPGDTLISGDFGQTEPN